MPGGRYKELRSMEFPKNQLNDKMPKTKVKKSWSTQYVVGEWIS